MRIATWLQYSRRNGAPLSPSVFFSLTSTSHKRCDEKLFANFLEMEKALEELKKVVEYQMKALKVDQQQIPENALHRKTGITTHNDRSNEILARHQYKQESHHYDSRSSKSRRFLGIGMTARRNLCIHPEIAQEADRDKIDEKCTRLTAPWMRKKRIMGSLNTNQSPFLLPNSGADDSSSQAMMSSTSAVATGRQSSE